MIIKESNTELPDIPPTKVFNPKLPLLRLNNYKSIGTQIFWNSFPKNHSFPGKSLINPTALRNIAQQANLSDLVLLEQVISDITYGAAIGCRGEYRNASLSTNAPSAYLYGPQVTDAIGDWIEKGFAYGPVKQRDVPKGVKINGIMCKPKPNGSVRVILNLSSPAGTSVNDGISISEFPATMSSTTAWLRSINKAGKGCHLVKID